MKVPFRTVSFPTNLETFPGFHVGSESFLAKSAKKGVFHTADGQCCSLAPFSGNFFFFDLHYTFLL